MSSVLFWKLGKEFYHASRDQLVKNQEHLVSFPCYYLAGHSIELSLKAFLFGNNYSVSDLRKRKYGHDLESLLDEAIKNDFENECALSFHEKLNLERLNNYYKEKELEYLESQIYALPEMQKAVELAGKVSNKLARFISGQHV